MGAFFDSVPQLRYRPIGFDWDRSLDNLRTSSLVFGDLSDEAIAETKRVACGHIKVLAS